MELVIVGNGIIALTAAFRAARRGQAKKIVVIGPPARDGSATLAAAAMLNSFAEIEVGSLDTELDRLRFDLSRRASEMWPEFGDALVQVVDGTGGIERLGFGLGTYVVNNATADDLDDENFDAILAELAARGEPHSHVTPRDIPNYLPAQRQRAARAVFIANEGWLNPRLVMTYLDRALATFPQVQFVAGTAERLRASNGAITGVVLDDGRVCEGSDYLLAAGATVTGILERSALPIAIQRVFYGVGCSLELRSPDARHTHVIRTPNRGLACGIYSAPYYQGAGVANDHVIVGASNFIAPEPYPHVRLGSVDVLVRGAIEQINRNFYRADLVRVNVGWRPTSQDTYPLIGRSSLANLLVATGTKRDGFHLAPLISEYLDALLHREAGDPRLAVFTPERPLIFALTRAQAVAKAVRHQINSAYSHGYTPPHSRMEDSVVQMQRDAIERLHDQVGAIDWGIPPEMLDMYRYGHAKA